MIYMILYHSFDSTENSIGDAVNCETLGYIIDKEQADDIVVELNRKYGRKYKGWDSERYPYYTAKLTEPLDITKLNKFGH